jgi:Ni/Fe-hydrogenase subunit HybB-like protein
VTAVLMLLLVAGVSAFLSGTGGPDPVRAWQIFLVNFLFWSGVAQAGPIFAAIYQVTEARWGSEVKRLAEGLGFFLPVSLFFFLVLFLGESTLFHAASDSSPERQLWLSLPFFFIRDTLGLVLLYGVSLAVLYYSIRPDLGPNGLENGTRRTGVFPRLVTRGWLGTEAERERSKRRLLIFAPVLLVLYAAVFSLVGIDLVMSLDPEWYSALFGAYFFISNIYLGLAAIAIVVVLGGKSLKKRENGKGNHLFDLANLIFAFCLLTGHFLWSQYLVIWYGNLPEETEYLILRTKSLPWAPVAWSVFIMTFVVPFVIFLNRRVKQSPVMVLAVAFLVAAGMWLERYILVVPSLSPQTGLLLGWTELFITGGFLSAMILTYMAFLRWVPIDASASAQSYQTGRS